jgi:hypothetical protein
MKKLILALLLGTATNAFACEWKLTVENLVTNELQYFRTVVGQGTKFIELHDPINKKSIKCSHQVSSVSMENDSTKKYEEAVVGCSGGEYITFSKGILAGSRSDPTYLTSAFYTVVNHTNKPTMIYQLTLACE